MISLIVFCVDKKTNNFQYSFLNTLEKRIDIISRSLKAQIDIHKLFNIPNLVILTNFPFYHNGVTAIDISEALCEKNFWGNKYTLPLKYVKDYSISDDIWLHDYDCFPQEKFDFPTLFPNQIGGIFTGNNYVNGGSLFIRKDNYEFFNSIKRVYDITPYHRSDEILLNDFFFNKQKIIDTHKDKRIVNIFQEFDKTCAGLDNTYNYSFSMAKRVKKLDFVPKAIHFHPESLGQENCFSGKGIIKDEINAIFKQYCPPDFQKENEVLYRKWRHKT